jgi:hypothetical protein
VPAAPLVALDPLREVVVGGVVEVVGDEVDDHRRPGGHLAQPAGQARDRREAQRALDDDVPGALVAIVGVGGRRLLDLDRRPHDAAQDEQQRERQPGDHAGEQVGDHDPEDRHDVHRQLAVAVQLAHVREAHQPRADHHEQPGQHGHRDLLHEPEQRHREHDDPGAVQDRRRPAPRARRDVRRAADDDARDRQAAEQARERVAGALADELAVEVGPGPGMHAVDGDGREQALDAGDDRDGQDSDRERTPLPLGQHRRGDRLEQRATDLDPLDGHRAQPGHGGDEHDGEQRRGDAAHPAGQTPRQPRPDQQDRDDGEAERGRGTVQGDQLPGELEDSCDRVVLLLTAEHDVQLTEHDRHADAREHPVHDGRGDRERRAAGPRQAEQDLQHPRGHGDRAGHAPAEAVDEVGDDDGEAPRGSADLQRGAAEGAGHETADGGGDQPRGQRGVGGHRDAQRERHGDEEDDE